MNGWVCTDPDCCQYMKHDGSRYEMIEVLWLDAATEEDGKSRYVVLNGTIDMNDYTPDEIEGYVSAYNFAEPITEDMKAECILEETLLSDAYAVKLFRTEEVATAYVECYIQTNIRR